MPPSNAQSVYKQREIAWNGYHLTSGDVARLLEVDLKTVHNWVSRGHVVGRRTEGRHLRFQRSEIVRFMRRFGYQVPSFFGDAPPKVVLVGSKANMPAVKRALSRGFEASPCEDLFRAALCLADGTYEAAVIDLDECARSQVNCFSRALRSWNQSQQVCLVGVAASRSARQQFVTNGGDAALAPSRSRDLKAVIRWLVGASKTCPSSVHLCREN